MSRVYQKPAASTTRRPPATREPLRPPATREPVRPPATREPPRLPATRDPLRPSATREPVRPPPPTSTTRDARAPIRGRTMHTQPPRQERAAHDDGTTNQPERTILVGDGYHMFTPSNTKREQMKRQAENEQRQYEAHVERTRLHNLHEVNRLGGDGLSEDEVRRRQAEKYRVAKYARLEKSHQEQIEKKQEEERGIEAKKQAARQLSIENEKRHRNAQLRSMRSTVNQDDQGATGWTDEAREQDRQQTMDRFLNRLTQQYNAMDISSDNNQKRNQNNLSKSDKLSILHDTLPDIDDQTLEYYLETYNGDIDTIVHELLN